MSQYEMPAYGEGGGILLSWLLEALQEGEGWFQSQGPAREYERVLKLFDATPPDAVEGLSNLGYNRVERNARDIVASLSNFRHEGEFRPAFDQALYDTAHSLTKIDRAWAQTNHVYDTLRSNLQNAVAFGTGYLMADWDNKAHGTFGDVRLRALHPNDVRFVQLPRNHDIQQAYMVIVREELPINLARRIYGDAAGLIVPDRDNPGWIQKGLRAVQRVMGGSPALAVSGMGQNNNRGSFPTVDIFHAYTLDNSINESGTARQMGVEGTNWSYTVPSLNDQIPIPGAINPATGATWTRQAKPEDCLLFPLRRYTIFTRSKTLEDGSSPWWHGAAPVARLRFNDWAWEALGRSLMADPQRLQDGIIEIMRLVEDSIAGRLNPALLYDDALVSEGFSDQFNPRMSGSRAKAQLNTGGDILKPALSADYYNVPAFVPDWVKHMEGLLDHQMGTPDLVAMAKAKQVPGQGTLEKLMEMAGPLVDDMVRAQEVPYTQLGEWRKALYFQFYTRNRFIKIVGPMKEDTETFQFNPDLLIGRRPDDTVESRQQRARGLISEFVYHLEESSINERFRMSNKLALLQLKKAGVMIDDWTIAEAFNIHNYGPKPEGTRNVLERFVAESHLRRELAEEMAGGMAQAGGQQGPGRPNSNKKPPHVVSKEGGLRSTVSTS